jgi:CRP-like cAMP-binding protein
MKQYIAQIMASPLFARLKEEEVASMLGCMDGKVKKYSRDEIIILSSEQVQYAGILLEGCVHMVKENNLGDRTLLTIIREGEVFGESFACGDELLSYSTFVAAQNTTVFFVPLQKILYGCNLKCIYHHKLVENMVTMMANKNVRLMEKIDVSSQKTIREKILTYLQMQKQKQGEDYIDVKLSRTVLAEYLGVNRSALTRELALMKEEGILNFEKNRFYLEK